MSAFWIVGIILNVGLTGLLIYWVFKQMRPRHERASDEPTDAPGGSGTGGGTGTQTDHSKADSNGSRLD